MRWIYVGAALLTVLVWSHWSTITHLIKEWRSDQNYSVGALVPLAAAYLLWRDRSALQRRGVRPCWLGILVVILAEGMRSFGFRYYFESAERYALVLAIHAVVLLVTGWRVYRRAFWILLFLLLMVPLPGRVHNMISGPLQTLATTGAVFLLELFGETVSRSGNTMVLNDTVQIGVVEACSGLRMLTAFIVVAAVLAFLIRRPLWQKIVLLASSIFVAIACNVVRLFVTAELYVVADSETAEAFFHDFAGLVMMPCAVLLLLAELWVMKKLVTTKSAPTDASPGKTKDDVN